MPGAKSSGHRAQTLSSPGSSSDGSGQADPCAPLPSARHLSPPYARARMLLGGHYPCPVAELPPTPSFSPLVPPPCALPSDPRQDSQCVSVCVHALTCAFMETPRGISPTWEGVGRGPPGSEGLSSQSKPHGRVEAGGGGGNHPRSSGLCPPPSPRQTLPLPAS